MTNEIVTLKVRTTASFREKLALTAKENNRSMNAEIVYRLEKSFSLDNVDTPNENQSINRGVAGLNTRSRPATSDPRERRRLAILAADAALRALDEDEGK